MNKGKGKGKGMFGGGKAKGKGKGACHTCGEQGHFARECPKGRGAYGIGYGRGDDGGYEGMPTLSAMWSGGGQQAWSGANPGPWGSMHGYGGIPAISLEKIIPDKNKQKETETDDNGFEMIKKGPKAKAQQQHAESREHQNRFTALDSGEPESSCEIDRTNLSMPTEFALGVFLCSSNSRVPRQGNRSSKQQRSNIVKRHKEDTTAEIAKHLDALVVEQFNKKVSRESVVSDYETKPGQEVSSAHDGETCVMYDITQKKMETVSRCATLV